MKESSIATTLKSARIELLTTDEAKKPLSMAAALGGVDLTTFVLGAAIDEARQAIAEHATISLTREGQITLAGLLQQLPAVTTNAMLQLMNMPCFSEP